MRRGHAYYIAEVWLLVAVNGESYMCIAEWPYRQQLTDGVIEVRVASDPLIRQCRDELLESVIYKAVDNIALVILPAVYRRARF